MTEFISNSGEETFSFAEKAGKILPSDTLLVLSGDLGAGKTVFAKGLAVGLGVKEKITSPTFMLAHEYESGRLPFSHMDAYRLEGEEIEDLGLEDYWRRGGICLIEWGEILEPLLPRKYTHIIISGSGEEPRHFKIEGEYEEMFADIIKVYGE